MKLSNPVEKNVGKENDIEKFVKPVDVLVYLLNSLSCMMFLYIHIFHNKTALGVLASEFNMEIMGCE